MIWIITEVFVSLSMSFLHPNLHPDAKYNIWAYPEFIPYILMATDFNEVFIRTNLADLPILVKIRQISA